MVITNINSNSEIDPKQLQELTPLMDAEIYQNKQALKSNFEAESNLEADNQYLIPEDFWTSEYHSFKLNTNPTDKSLEFKWKVFKYWNWSYAGWKGPTWEFYTDYWITNNDSFSIWEFQDWELVKWLTKYSVTQTIQYDTWTFEEWRLKQWIRKWSNWTIEQWEFDGYELKNWARKYPDGKQEFVIQ